MDEIFDLEKRTGRGAKMSERYGMSGIADWLEATRLRKIRAKNKEKDQEREKDTREDSANVVLKGQTRMALGN